jgi:Uma2 family endonuclease
MTQISAIMNLVQREHSMQMKKLGVPNGLELGPHSHGRAMTLDEFVAASSEEGFQYELIDGKLYVSPQADQPQNYVELWVFGALFLYSLQHPSIINHVSNKARVFVPGRRKVTNPEPDVACYRDFPKDVPFETIRWQDIAPILVVEVASDSDPDKDLVRNVDLYRQVPTIEEYWIFDTRENPAQPTMLAYRRRGKTWRKLQLAHGETYATPLLPGFALVIDPRV